MNGGQATQSTWELFLHSLQVFGQKFMDTIPGFLGAILVVAVAWLLARLVSSGFERLLQLIKFDVLAERVQLTKFLQQMGVLMTPSALIGRGIYWVFVLLIIASAAETLGWTVVRDQTQRLIGYLPNLVSALIFFVIGSYLASFARDFMRNSMGSLGISTARIISSAIYYLLFIMVVLTAMQQGGFDTHIIWSNLLLIIGSIMAAAAISYGFASKDVLSNILAGFFNKRTYTKGMMIEVNDIRGIIVEMTNIAITLQTAEGDRFVIPSKTLMNSTVRIIAKK